MNCIKVAPLPLLSLLALVVLQLISCDKNDAGAQMTTPSVGKVIEIKLSGGEVMKFCYCPAGSFVMGSPVGEADRGIDEDQVKVTLSQGFWLAQTPCTQGQWQAVMGKNPSTFQGSKDLPVEMVTWDEAVGYCERLMKSVKLPAGWKISLPTDAQWEYACRAGTRTAFNFGAVLNGTQANCNGNYPYGTTLGGPNLGKTCVVGRYPANNWGIYDMHGNVWEWCADWYGEQLPGGTDPVGAATGTHRVTRGGSYLSEATTCRAAAREGIGPRYRYAGLGFRPVIVEGSTNEGLVTK